MNYKNAIVATVGFIAMIATTACGPNVKGVGSTGATAAATTTTTTAKAKPAKYTFTPSDFTIDVTVTSSKCFGSAGCSVKYTITPTFLGPASALEEGQKLTVIYTITGGEEPVIDRFTLSGSKMRYTEESSVSTESADYTLTAEVTKVLDQ